MTKEEKITKCKLFFNVLSDRLSDSYEVIGSCNQDLSAYLCPNGTTDQVSYNGKPELSFRISDHWNWYSNTRKCSNPNYIQCYSRDLPYPCKRDGNKATKPKLAACVALYKDGIYKVVYGEHFDRKTKTWSWIENDLETVLSSIN